MERDRIEDALKIVTRDASENTAREILEDETEPGAAAVRLQAVETIKQFVQAALNAGFLPTPAPLVPPQLLPQCPARN